jgi:hypothetical protein
MHFCSDELLVIVNALQVGPSACLHWLRVVFRRRRPVPEPTTS